MRVKSSSSPKARDSISLAFRGRKIPTPLQVLVAFLNQDLDRLSGRLRWEASPISAIPGAEEEFRAVQERVRNDVLSIIESVSPTDTEANLRRVVAKLESMKVVISMGVWRWESETRRFLSDLPHVSLGHPFEINGVELFTFEGPTTQSLEEVSYWDLFSALRSGEFSRLRKCLRCSKFFAPKDLKRIFCSDRCKDEYHNEQRQKKGYFTEVWQKRRNRALLKAKRLLKEGISLKRVCKETKLTPGILRRSGLIA